MDYLPAEILIIIFEHTDPEMIILSMQFINGYFNTISRNFFDYQLDKISLQKYIISISNREHFDFNFIEKFEIKISYDEICGQAADNGNLECLKYAHENGCP